MEVALPVASPGCHQSIPNELPLPYFPLPTREKHPIRCSCSRRARRVLGAAVHIYILPVRRQVTTQRHILPLSEGMIGVREKDTRKKLQGPTTGNTPTYYPRLRSAYVQQLGLFSGFNRDTSEFAHLFHAFPDFLD